MTHGREECFSWPWATPLHNGHPTSSAASVSVVYAHHTHTTCSTRYKFVCVRSALFPSSSFRDTRRPSVIPAIKNRLPEINILAFSGVVLAYTAPPHHRNVCRRKACFTITPRDVPPQQKKETFRYPRACFPTERRRLMPRCFARRSCPPPARYFCGITFLNCKP